jgi:hypothetical protein
LPDPLAERQASDAVGRLASFMSNVERDPPAVQPVAPDGRFELVPLVFITLGRNDQARILGAIDNIAAATPGRGHPAIDGFLNDYAGTAAATTEMLERLRRLATLIQLPWDDDVDTLQATLHRGAASIGRPIERIVLTAEEHAAYERVTDRILSAWSGDDALERFVYRGAPR